MSYKNNYFTVYKLKIALEIPALNKWKINFKKSAKQLFILNIVHVLIRNTVLSMLQIKVNISQFYQKVIIRCSASQIIQN